MSWDERALPGEGGVAVGSLQKLRPEAGGCGAAAEQRKGWLFNRAQCSCWHMYAVCLCTVLCYKSQQCSSAPGCAAQPGSVLNRLPASPPDPPAFYHGLPSVQAARQAGWQPIPGVRYRKFRWTISPRMQWIAATERAETAAQLALSLRQLDPMLQVRRPAGWGGLGAWWLPFSPPGWGGLGPGAKGYGALRECNACFF